MLDNHKPTHRRVFLNKLFIASASIAFSPSIFSAFGKPDPRASESLLVMDPMTAMAIAKTSLDLISSFTGSKDSGIAAMMRHQTALLENISQQIDQIQFKLVEIQNAIQNLPQEIKVLLADQFKIELVAEIQAAVLRYNNNILIPSRRDPSIIKNDDVRAEINNIIFEADQKISTLNQTKIGIGPEACMIAPLAMSLTIAGKTALHYPNATIISTLQRYYDWFADMQSDKKGSISDVLNAAARDHDNYLAALDSDPLALRMGLSNFKLNGSQVKTTANDPGVLFSVFDAGHIEGISFDSRGGTTNSEKIFNICRGIYRRKGTMNQLMSKELGAWLISYQREARRIYARDENLPFTYFTPKNGEYYYVHGVTSSGKFSTAMFDALIDNDQTAAASDNVSRAKMEVAISQANVERARIAYCAQALIVAANSQKRIKEYLTILN